eukprot:10389623-Lingulodinium_polyedra.AAC.1
MTEDHPSPGGRLSPTSGWKQRVPSPSFYLLAVTCPQAPVALQAPVRVCRWLQQVLAITCPSQFPHPEIHVHTKLARIAGSHKSHPSKDSTHHLAFTPMWARSMNNHVHAHASTDAPEQSRGKHCRCKHALM